MPQTITLQMLLERRLSLGLTQKEFYQLIGVPLRTGMKWETVNGRINAPAVQYRLQKAFEALDAKKDDSK